MMDTCKHVLRLSLAADHSVLNPQRWHCCSCGTTESVWACLSCPHVACGRYIEEHALKHSRETKHSLAIEVNDKYVFCYECNDYVLNDNPAGDIKMLRSCLTAVTTQSFRGVSGGKKRLLRSYSYNPSFSLSYSDSQFRDDDQTYTAIWFRRYYLLAKALTAWRKVTREDKVKLGVGGDVPSHGLPSSSALYETPSPPMQITSTPAQSALPATSRAPTSSNTSTPTLTRKRFLIPGVTGLRNLGNTCYMNSILQVLSHLTPLREWLLQLNFHAESGSSEIIPAESGSGEVILAESGSSEVMRPSKGCVSALRLRRGVLGRTHHLMRQTTMECFEYVSSGEKPGASSSTPRGGLIGGAEPATPQTRTRPNPSKESMLLSRELHALLRVMWSGKWALVSPHKMLYSVWNLIPFFKGYSQQDAQEFLCEFLGKVQSEMEKMAGKGEGDKNWLPGNGGTNTIATVVQETKKLQDIMTRMFQGELVSEVKCLRCEQVSQTCEPFMDLSLEFPDRYQVRNYPMSYTSGSNKVCVDPCHVEEMLQIFTDWEKLDGRIYLCENCNKRRRRVSSQRAVYTQVKKRLVVRRLPHILRLHLKRFMWSGRNNRGKIGAQVTFSPELELKGYCHEELQGESYLYQLSAVVMHHGRGFGSGHYTSYCWNQEANSWVHCNDAKMELCSVEEVRGAQAYIIVYTRKDTNIDSADLAVPLDLTSNVPADDDDDEIAFNFKSSCIPKFKELKRKLNLNEKGRQQLKRRKSTIW